MIRKSSLAMVAGAASLLFLVAGCGEQFILKHSPLTASAQSTGTVSLVVNNKRPSDKGGSDELYMGQVRNAYGMPFKKSSENSVVVALKALFTEALANAGYKVADGAATQVVVDVNAFFMDGYMGYKIESVCAVKAVSGGATAYETEIKKENGFYYGGDGDIYRAFDTNMDLIAQQAVSAFSSAEFKAAVK
jgi:hypothetical protein